MPSKSPAQARLMAAVAHGWRPPSDSGIKVPMSVAKDFFNADHPKAKKLAKGGSLANMKFSDPKQNEHIQSYTQDLPIGHGTGLQDLKRGISNWGPELLGFAGDIGDVITNTIQRAQGKRGPNIAPGTLGDSARAKFGHHAPKRTQTEMREPYETPPLELAANLANPLMFLSPTKMVALAEKYPQMAAIIGALHGLPEVAPQMGALGVIKERGGNWLNSPAIKKAMGRLKRGDDVELMPTEEYNKMDGDFLRQDPERFPFIDPHTGELFTARQAEDIQRNWTIDKWIDGPLTKYLKRDMATPEDPIRKLAEQGILHIPPDDLRTILPGEIPNQRILGQSPAEKKWESASDNQIYEHFADLFQVPELKETEIVKANPWIAKLPPETPIYDLPDSWSLASELGFYPLIQNLHDAMYSGKLRPDQLTSGNFSVEAAVRMAHENRIAAEEAEKARQLALSRNSATVVHKEYPDSPEGFHWVEFKLPNPQDQIAPVGHPALRGPYPDVPDDELLKLRQRAERTVNDHYGDVLDDEDFDKLVAEHLQDLVIDWRETNRSDSMKTLQDSLDYEGDEMGHCIGGYCPDVASGQTRLFSLRDARGKPHVSIQASTGEGTRYLKDDIYQSSEGLEKLYDEKHGPGAFWQLVRGEGAPGMTPSEVVKFQSSIDDDHDIARWLLDNNYQHLLEDSWLTPPQKSLYQIKGSGKKNVTQDITPEDAPRLFPYIQDFIKEGGWNEVHDIQNTGLVNLNTARRHSVPGTHPEFLKFLDEKINAGDNFFPKEELLSIYEKYHGPDASTPFAEGGQVKAYPEGFFDDLDLFLGLK